MALTAFGFQLGRVLTNGGIKAYQSVIELPSCQILIAFRKILLCALVRHH